MQNESKAEIAYILKGFPRLSETFIANEIHLLESMGMKLRLYSVKPGETDMVHGVVEKIRAPLTYVPEATSVSDTSLFKWLRDNLGKFRASHGRLLARRPVAYLKTLAGAAHLAWRYRRGWNRPRKVIIKEFFQAGYIADQVLAAPSIRHLHGHFCHGATTITWFVSRITGLPFSFTAHAKDIYEKSLNPGDLLERKLEAASFATTCTAANERHLSALYPHCRVVHTIYHGLDTDYFTPHRDVQAEQVPTILSVGRFVEKKGFAYLVEACALLKQRGARFRCVLVGEKGDQSEKIAQMIRDLDLSDTVVMKGAVTQEQLRGIYADASIFALPCLVVENGDRDGIPNVMAEAMAMAIPIVSTDVSGIPELVDDGVEGLLVPERDSAALAQAIGRLLDDSELRRRLGNGGRAKVCAVFDSRRTTQRLKDLFQTVMVASGMAA